MTVIRTLSVVTAAALALSACSTVSKVGSLNPFHGKRRHESTAARGVRIPVIAAGEELKVSPALKGQDFFLPPPSPQSEWPLSGGNLAQSVEHVDAAPNFEVAWRRSFGAPSSRKHHVTSPPIVAGGRIYLMDGAADVSAHDAASGSQIWRTNIMPKSKRDHEAWGGGIAYADGKIFVTSGFREVVALDAATGRLLWRTTTEAPMHAAPTVSDARVFAEDVNDEMFAYDTSTGTQEWTYQALTDPARIIAATSPAVENDTLVGSFASGELIALRTANGAELWNAALSHANRTNALSEIRDIPGRPVIYKSDVYAVSHSDMFAAVDIRTGQVRWTLPVSAITTPWPAGDVVYVVDDTGQVICASRDAGQVYWIRNLNDEPLPGGKKRSKKHKLVYWSTPILASGRLITVSSQGNAVALNPKTGVVEKHLHLGADAMIGPVAVNGTLYVVSESAQLIAIR